MPLFIGAAMLRHFEITSTTEMVLRDSRLFEKSKNKEITSTVFSNSIVVFGGCYNQRFLR